jgi:hypothetical protein
MRLIPALAALALVFSVTIGAEARMRFQGTSENGIADQASQPVETRGLAGITLPTLAR